MSVYLLFLIVLVIGMGWAVVSRINQEKAAQKNSPPVPLPPVPAPLSERAVSSAAKSNVTAVERARAIRLARETKAQQLVPSTGLPAFDAEASQRRVRDVVQDRKDASAVHAWVSDDVGPLRMELFLSNAAPPTEWARRYTHLYLLSRFHSGADLFAFHDHPAYADRLGMSPEVVLDRFIKAGLIRKFNAEEALDHNLKVVEIKEILKSHSLATSGKKADLIKRLVGVDDQRVRNASESVFYVATAAGLNGLAVFYEHEKLRHQAAFLEIRQAVRLGDIGEALRVSAEYNEILMWSAARFGNDEFGRSALAGILSSKLGNEPERELAAMMALMPSDPPAVRPI